jgi:hypothetical protein
MIFFGPTLKKLGFFVGIKRKKKKRQKDVDKIRKLDKV